MEELISYIRKCIEKLPLQELIDSATENFDALLADMEKSENDEETAYYLRCIDRMAAVNYIQDNDFAIMNGNIVEILGALGRFQERRDVNDYLEDLGSQIPAHAIICSHAALSVLKEDLKHKGVIDMSSIVQVVDPQYAGICFLFMCHKGELRYEKEGETYYFYID